MLFCASTIANHQLLPLAPRFPPSLNDRSLFDKSGCLVPWFHGQTSREEAVFAIEEWEATRREGRQQRGVFLFRYSDRQVCRSVEKQRGPLRQAALDGLGLTRLSCCLAGEARGCGLSRLRVDSVSSCWFVCSCYFRCCFCWLVPPLIPCSCLFGEKTLCMPSSQLFWSKVRADPSERAALRSQMNYPKIRK